MRIDSIINDGRAEVKCGSGHATPRTHQGFRQLRWHSAFLTLSPASTSSSSAFSLSSVTFHRLIHPLFFGCFYSARLNFKLNLLSCWIGYKSPEGVQLMTEAFHRHTSGSTAPLPHQRILRSIFQSSDAPEHSTMTDEKPNKKKPKNTQKKKKQ